MNNFKFQISDFKYSKFLVLICLLWTLVCGLWSCHTVRQTLKQPLKERGVDYLFENLRKNDLHYKWLSAKFSATVEFNDKRNSFSGLLRIQNDSIIWVSVTPVLGIEAVRIYITHDSVKFINRIDKNYLAGNYDYVNNWLGTDFDFEMIESLLAGNDLIYYDIDKFKARIDNREYKLSTVNRRKIKKYIRKSKENLQVLLQDIWLDPETFKISHTNLRELKESRKLDVTYSDFRGVSNQIAPNKLTFVVEDKNPIKITIKYSRITIDEPLSFPFRIPAEYEKMK
jgi:hypothetical protein